MFFFSGKENPLNDIIAAAGLHERRVCACMYLPQRLSLTNGSNLRACVRERQTRVVTLSFASRQGKKLRRNPPHEQQGDKNFVLRLFTLLYFKLLCDTVLLSQTCFFSSVHAICPQEIVAQQIYTMPKKCGGRRFLTIANTIKCHARSVQGRIGIYKGFLFSDWRYFRWHGKIN